MPPSHPVFLAQVASTFALVGLIWVVQLVIYPQFRDVGEGGGRAAFRRYHDAYTRRITWIVGPLIGVEGLTSLALVFSRPEFVSASEAGLGLGLAAALFVGTGLWYAPLHGELGAGYDPAKQRRLTVTNWLRTLAWSARGALVLIWIARLSPAPT